MRYVDIHCTICAQMMARVHGAPFLRRTVTRARHVHTSETRRGRLVFGKARCFNQCIECGALYSTVACGRGERDRVRRAERYGQLRLEGA